VSVLEAVKQANRDGPPEHSVLFRVSSTACVVVAIAACWSQQELSPTLALTAIAAVIVGNLFSYWRRGRSLPWLKVVLALAVLASFVWFFATVTRHASLGSLAAVEGPLAVLFTLIQVTHAFDVPSRRDLGFSLAGSATLMAVAAAQAIDSSFGLYVIVWAAFGLVGLMAMWSSMVGGAPLRARTVGLVGLAVVVVAVAVVAVLPAPHASSTVIFPSSLGGDQNLSTPDALVGGGAHGTEPLSPASSNGRTRVGGFLGFAGPLDTAIRGSLGNEVIFRVRADRPTFWLAGTYDEWNGQAWVQTSTRAGRSAFVALTDGPPFTLPLPADEVARGTPDIQTFYLSVTGPNLIFHAANANQVWFPSSRLFWAEDGTIRAGTSLGAGTIYTVESLVNTATPAQLTAAQPDAFPGSVLSGSQVARYTQLPHPYPKVQALAERITAGQSTVYGKVTALEGWIARNTRYTTDIPALAPGQDTVTEFLFGNRLGYCEQISTALAVMLRTLDIPAREATGYVPGPYNPLTDLYEVQARDAHAWVQVWFPGYGWQSFDPTASVPLANPTPASALAHDVGGALHRLPLVPLAAALGVLALLLAVVQRRRHAPRTWAGAITAELERAARRARIPVTGSQALGELGAELDRRRPPGAPPPEVTAVQLALAAERASYGTGQPDPETRRRYLKAAKALRRRARKLRRTEVSPPPPPAPRPTTPPQPVGAGRP